MVNFWITTTTEGSWRLTQAHNVHAFNREADRDKVKPGDKLVFYIIRSDPPVFVAAYEVAQPWEDAKDPFWPEEKVEGRVIWPWRFQLTPLRQGAVDARKLTRQLRFIDKREAWPAYFIGSLGNFGRPIPESDYLRIFEDLANPPITYTVRLGAKMVTAFRKKLTRLKEAPPLHGPAPAHNELRDMIRDIGLIKGLVAETEYPINDLRLDVAWRTEVQKQPARVWEVQIAGNFYEALAKLKHAWDYWRAEPFLVTTEKYEDQAKSLLGGTFHEIKPHIRIILWQDIVRLYKLMTEVAKIEKGLRL